MQGKILSPQLISGDDGKRYEYDKNDVINLGNKDLAVLTGSQVEFLSFDKRVAKSIYIINENLNVSGILSADSISSARANALLGIGLLFFSFIPDIEKIIGIRLQFFNFIPYNIGHIWPIIGIVGLVLYLMAIYSVSKAAASKSLFKNYIIALIIGFLGIFFAYIPAIMSGLGGMLLLGAMFALIALIAPIYFYKIHAELARLSGSSLFLWSSWIYVVSVLLFFSVFGIFVGFTGFIIFWCYILSRGGALER
ncbi:MAG: hypothetical protein MR782_03545 [Campylobacter sp.]|nr:hypothetical protein [Campylobacter sp.]